MFSKRIIYTIKIKLNSKLLQIPEYYFIYQPSSSNMETKVNTYTNLEGIKYDTLHLFKIIDFNNLPNCNFNKINIRKGFEFL